VVSRKDKQINGTDQSPSIDTNTYSYNCNLTVTQRGKYSYLVNYHVVIGYLYGKNLDSLRQHAQKLI
jgi:hypothetical protein